MALVLLGYVTEERYLLILPCSSSVMCVYGSGWLGSGSWCRGSSG